MHSNNEPFLNFLSNDKIERSESLNYSIENPKDISVDQRNDFINRRDDAINQNDYFSYQSGSFLPENCFSNNNLCETVSSVLFSLSNQRHAIIVGEDESGITQVARWCAECFNRMTSEENNYSAKNNCFCLCTKNLQCSDLIGQTKPCPKTDKGENNEILKFFPGFLVSAIEEGKTVVLDCINEANATVGERLNGLLDKKNNAEEEFFDLPENTERLGIPIHKNFRMICTCNLNNLKDMSPAFVNRFDVVVLENQLENLNDTQYFKLIANIFN